MNTEQSQESTTKLRSDDTSACLECGASLHVGSGSVPIEKNTEQSLPQWIAVLERIAVALEQQAITGKAVFYQNQKMVAFCESVSAKAVPTPPPQPKTREQEDEKAFRRWFKNDQGTDYGNIEEQSKRAYLQGRRDERKEK